MGRAHCARLLTCNFFDFVSGKYRNSVIFASPIARYVAIRLMYITYFLRLLLVLVSLGTSHLTWQFGEIRYLLVGTGCHRPLNKSEFLAKQLYLNASYYYLLCLPATEEMINYNWISTMSTPLPSEDLGEVCECHETEQIFRTFNSVFVKILPYSSVPGSRFSNASTEDNSLNTLNLKRNIDFFFF